MSQIWMDGFDHYGGSVSHMLEGPWAQIVNAVLSTEQQRTGEYSFKFKDNTEARRALGIEVDNLIVSMGLYVPGLPPLSQRAAPLQFRNGANIDIVSLTIRPDGVLEARRGSETGTIIGQTTGSVISTGTWHHIEAQMFRSDTVGTLEVRVDEVIVMNLSALDLGTTNIAQVAHFYESIGGLGHEYFVDDLITRDTLGSFNTGFEGDLRVATLLPASNGDNQGWSVRSIEKLGGGVLDVLDTDREEGVAYTDIGAFAFGSSEFTLETFVRFETVPVASETHQIFGKWREDDEARSFRLYVTGPSAGGNIVFQMSTGGTAGSVLTIHSFPFAPVQNRWYHIAVSRQGTVNRLFIDGVQVGLDQNDPDNYFNGEADLMVNSEQGTATNTAKVDSGVSGWMDGFRFTVDFSRYSDNFTPPTQPLPDTIGTDPLYNNVQLLLNFDDAGNTDQSNNNLVGTLVNGANILFPDDRLAFQTINDLDPNDNDFVEADEVSAEGTLTFIDNPSDGQSLDLGSVTYFFQTVLVQLADNIQIGADAQESLDNLKAAVNLEAGGGTKYGSPTAQNPEAFMIDLPSLQVLATARTPGAVGNSVITLTNITNASWSSGTLLGGLDIPDNSEFNLTTLPAEVTGVRAVAIVGRNFKIDSGSSQMQMSLVTLGGAVADGADRPVTLNPTYYEDTIEQDPNTAGPLTPTTILGSRIRLNRTV